MPIFIAFLLQPLLCVSALDGVRLSASPSSYSNSRKGNEQARMICAEYRADEAGAPMRRSSLVTTHSKEVFERHSFASAAVFHVTSQCRRVSRILLIFHLPSSL